MTDPPVPRCDSCRHWIRRRGDSGVCGNLEHIVLNGVRYSGDDAYALRARGWRYPTKADLRCCPAHAPFPSEPSRTHPDQPERPAEASHT